MQLFKRLAVPAFLGVLLWTTSSMAQPAEHIWQKIDVAPARKGPVQERILPEKLWSTRLNAVALRQILNRAPKEIIGQRIEGEEISLPMPDGTFARFRFVESPIMEPELAAKFPKIKTYRGEGIDDPAATVRFDISPEGFHAQILSPKGAVYIDPHSQGDAELHVSYFKRDFQRAADDFKCLLPEDAGAARSAATEGVVAERSGTVLRTYRLACAATGEYTQNRGGTVSSAMSAIVTAINRINQIYEAEIAVRLVLVANNDQVIYTNASTDPYTNNDGFAMLTQNINTLNSVIGSANYDIGHVFSTGGGGVAYLGSVCTSNKGGGVTGSSQPFGDPFVVDYVAHEIGHQFGANHTFNSSTNSCGGGNRNASTAYEPGSGSTIMAYAGICGSDNLQLNSDPYFHFASFNEIVAFLAGNGNCVTPAPTGNTVPTVNAGPNYTIPKGTPFTLTATASDANGDSLTYCWEQRDLGAAQALTAADNGASPLFRSFNPTNSPSRTFPRLANILNGTASVGEKLPTVGRTMKFRVTVRDNRSAGGGVNTADMQVVVDGNSGPFVITSPNSSVTWSNIQTVTWNVAGTASTPVNCSNVNILLSTNGGLTFPIVLATNTPNDGSESVVLPSVASSQARIKIEAVNNIFFDISDVNFTTTTYVGGPALVSVDSLTLIGESCTPTNNAVDPGETVQVRLGLRNIGNQNATNVTANLVADSGVLSPSGAQSYGTLTANGSAVTKDFSFTAMGTCGGTLPVRFEIRTNGVVSRVHTNIFFLGGYNLVTQARSNVSMINLPDGNASPYPSIINVSGLTGVIEKVTVTLTGLSHTWPADLDMVLVGPQGQNVMLMSDAGGSGQLNSVNLTFDDAAAASLPSGGGIPSGTYKPTDHPGSDSDLFPSGPVGPFGSVLSVFKDTQPNGNWALYIRDQYIDDTGNISGGWRLNIITRVPECCGGNVHAPVLAAIANRTVHVGSTLTITNTATDLDTPSHLLTYSLVTAPTGASIGNSSGILTWVPTQGQLGTHAFSVRVSDNGNPNLTDTKNFSVSVIDRPLQNSSISGNQFALQWSAISGRSYQVQMKTNLNQASWLNVGVITATGSTATFVEPPTSQQKYFRIIALD